MLASHLEVIATISYASCHHSYQVPEEVSSQHSAASNSNRANHNYQVPEEVMCSQSTVGDSSYAVCSHPFLR